MKIEPGLWFWVYDVEKLGDHSQTAASPPQPVEQVIVWRVLYHPAAMGYMIYVQG